MAFNKRKHLADNIEALRVAFSLKGSPPSNEQREVLKNYSGFGALNMVLRPAEDDGDISK